jgi:hypothetical protein
MGERPADVAAFGLGDRVGVGGAFGGEGAFHLGEECEQQERDAAHAFVRGVDRQRVGEGPYADAAACEVVHEVEERVVELAMIAFESVTSVGDLASLSSISHVVVSGFSRGLSAEFDLPVG